MEPKLVSSSGSTIMISASNYGDDAISLSGTNPSR